MRRIPADAEGTASPTCPSDNDRPPFRSAAYLRVEAQVQRFARSGRAPVLIEGESGTGKTQLARRLHRLSPRANGAFQYIVLSAIDDSLAGSELFGHVTGAFTDARYTRAGHFAAAANGTLFLDEIGKASKAVQQKLLHAIEYGEIRPIGSDRDVRVDVRIVAASNVSLAELAGDGAFLPDLYARLSAFRIVLPPLRERRPDIPLLVEHFVKVRSADAGYRHTPTVDPELMAALQTAPWPNNLRQLDGTIFRILVDAGNATELRLEHCLDELSYLREIGEMSDEPLTAEVAIQAIERAGSVAAAARLLGVNRTTVHRARKRSTPQVPVDMLQGASRNTPTPVAPHTDPTRQNASRQA